MSAEALVESGLMKANTSGNRGVASESVIRKRRAVLRGGSGGGTGFGSTESTVIVKYHVPTRARRASEAAISNGTSGGGVQKWAQPTRRRHEHRGNERIIGTNAFARSNDRRFSCEAAAAARSMCPAEAAASSAASAG